MSSSESDTIKISKYNSAGLLTISLNNLWQKAVTARVASNYVLWNSYLDAIWGELAGDLNEASPENSKFNDFYKKLSDIGGLNHSEIIGFDNQVDRSKRAEQYKILNDKHIWLKRLQNTQGKGTAYADEFEDDFD